MKLSNYFIRCCLVVLLCCSVCDVLAGKNDLNQNAPKQNQMEIDAESPPQSLLSQFPRPISKPVSCQNMIPLFKDKKTNISIESLKTYYRLTNANTQQEKFLDSVIVYCDFIVQYLGDIEMSYGSDGSPEMHLNVYPDVTYLPSDIFNVDFLTDVHILKGPEIENPSAIKNPLAVETPLEVKNLSTVETPLEVKNLSTVETPLVIGTPLVVETPLVIGNPLLVENPLVIGTPLVVETPLVIGTPLAIKNPLVVGNPSAVGTPLTIKTPLAIENLLVVENPLVIETPSAIKNPLVDETPLAIENSLVFEILPTIEISPVPGNSFGKCQVSRIKRIEIKRDVATICIREGANNLEKIEIYGKVDQLNVGFEKLKQIKVYGEIGEIERGTFGKCKELEEIEVGGIGRIKGYAFNLCPKLKKIKVYGNVWSICRDAFRQCKELKEIEVHGKLDEIEQSAFWECENLEKLDLKNGFRTIKDFAFQGCEKLKDYRWACNFDLAMKNIAYEKNSSIKIQPIPEDSTNCISIEDFKEIYGVSEIDKNWEIFFKKTIEYYNSLGKIDIIDIEGDKRTILTIHPAIKNIWINTISPYCIIDEIHIPEFSQIKTIEKDSFCNCNSLKKIEIFCELKSIEGSSFVHCKNLKEINFHKGIKEIDIPTSKALERIPNVILGSNVDYYYLYNFYPNIYNKVKNHHYHELPTERYYSNEGFNFIILPDGTAGIDSICKQNLDNMISMPKYKIFDIPHTLNYEKGKIKVTFISKECINSFPQNTILKIYAELKDPRRYFNFNPKNILSAICINPNKKTLFLANLGQGGYGSVKVDYYNEQLIAQKTMLIDDAYNDNLYLDSKTGNLILSELFKSKIGRNCKELSDIFRSDIFKIYSRKFSASNEFLFCEFLKNQQKEGKCPPYFPKIYSCEINLQQSNNQYPPHLPPKFLGNNTNSHIKCTINMELLPDLNLSEAVPSLSSNKITYEQKLNILYQLAEALNYMHENGFVHNDVRVPNIMFDKNTNKVHLIDFGFALKINQGVPLISMMEFPPERRNDTSNNFNFYNSQPSADAFSYGVIMYTLFTEKNVDYIFMSQSRRLSELKKCLLANDEGLCDLAEACISDEIDKRPTFNQIIHILTKYKSFSNCL